MILRAQFWLSLLMLAMVCFVCVGAALGARFSSVIPDYTAGEIARHRDINGVYLYDNGYIDSGDEVLVGQLPRSDHTRGGVYFIGDSQSKVAIMPYELSQQEQIFIHNYSIGGLGHRDLRFYLRTLIEDHGLLDAGAENVTIFLGISYHMIEEKNYQECYYVCGLFRRHGLYTYDGEEGIHRIRMSDLERFLRIQRVEANRFLRVLLFSPRRARGLARHEQTGPVIMPDDWRETMQTEVVDLVALLDYLQERNVRLRVVFRPSGSWIDTSPHEPAYRALVEPLLAARGIPLIDQADLLPDEEMGDFVHARYTGQVVLHEADRRLAHAALAEMGMAIPFGAGCATERNVCGP